MTTSRALIRITLLLIVAGLVAGPRPLRPRDIEVTAGSRDRILFFSDVTREVGAAGASRTWGSAWNDFNADGHPDLWIGRHWGPPRLLRGGPGRAFQDTTSPDLQRAHVDRHTCVWGEANGDGRPDIYCVRGADKGTGAGANQLFLRSGDVEFRNRAGRSGVTNPKGRGRTAHWIDFDQDGDLDLFAGNLQRPGVPNATYRNDGGTFTEVNIGLSESLWTQSSSWADWDVDGDPDLIVTQDDPFPTVAYENVDGRFQKVNLAHVSGRRWASAAWGDFDGDGRPDLHLVSETRSLVVRNAPDGFQVVDRRRLVQGRMSVWLDVDNDSDLDSFVVQGAPGKQPDPRSMNRPDLFLLNTTDGFRRRTGRSFRGPRDGNGDAVSTADYDRDGRVDLFLTNGLYQWTGRNALLRNQSKSGNWTALDIVGDRKNPMGFGATIVMRFGGRVVHRQVTDGANFHSQDETGYVHLGMDEAVTADIKIVWPNGSSDCVVGAHGVVLQVTEHSAPCPRGL